MIVARSRTQYGGRCERRGCTIRPGDRIVKVWDGRPGHKSKHGQGPGSWWCEDCVAELEPDAV
jgi:hypothetical protein